MKQIGECYIEMELPEPFMWYDESYLIYALNGMSTAPGAIRVHSVKI